MSGARKRSALLALAAAVVVTGAIVAVATTKGSGHHHPGPAATRTDTSPPPRDVSPPPRDVSSELALAAGYLGMSQAQLRGELRSGRTLAQIAASRAGKSSEGLLDALVGARAAELREETGSAKLSRAARERRLARLRRRIDARLDRIEGYAGLPASARYLGLRTSQLRAELESGRSLAQIADATPGKSATGLIDARVSGREAALESALASGKVSKATAGRLLSSLRRRITSEVQRTPSP